MTQHYPLYGVFLRKLFEKSLLKSLRPKLLLERLAALMPIANFSRFIRELYYALITPNALGYAIND